MEDEMQIRRQALLLSSLVVLGLLLTACGGDQPVTSPDSAGQEPSVAATGGPMIIEGKIVEVMESWPLQLTVETETGRYHVQLLSETTITREGETVDPGELLPDLQVQVEGQSSGSNAMTAQAIEVLSENR
jgi:hypothetical protein